MSYTQRQFTQIYDTAGAVVATGDKTFTGGQEVNISESIGNGANTTLSCPIIKNNVKALSIVAAGALTLKHNAGDGDPITLVANTPIVWNGNCGMEIPLTEDVENFYIDNLTGAAVELKIRALLDATP